MPFTPPPASRYVCVRVAQYETVISVSSRNVHDGDGRGEMGKRARSSPFGLLVTAALSGRSRMAQVFRGANRVTLFRLFAIGAMRRGRDYFVMAVDWSVAVGGESAGHPCGVRTFAAICCSECYMHLIACCGLAVKSGVFKESSRSCNSSVGRSKRRLMGKYPDQAPCLGCLEIFNG